MSQIVSIKDIIQDYISNPLVWTNDGSESMLISKDIPIQVNIGGYQGPINNFLHTIGSSYLEDLRRKYKAGWRSYELIFFTNAMAMIQYNEDLFDTFPRRSRGKKGDFWVDIPMDVVPFVYYFTEQDGINGSNMPDFDKTKLIIR